jgi:hypothetical protein
MTCGPLSRLSVVARAQVVWCGVFHVPAAHQRFKRSTSFLDLVGNSFLSVAYKGRKEPAEFWQFDPTKVGVIGLRMMPLDTWCECMYRTNDLLLWRA